MQKRRFDVVVYEQAPELGEVGAGLTISASAARVFKALGLGDELAALDSPTPHMGTLHYKTGERLAYERRDNEAYFEQHGGLTRQVHRADLHEVLAGALVDRHNTLRLGHMLTKIWQGGDQAILEFAHDVSDKCDLIIGCDGLKSVTRDSLFYTESPKFTGFVAWRGLVARSLVPDISLDPHFATYSSDDKLFVRYPVRHGTLVNYVAIARNHDFRSESWKAKADVYDVAAQFEDWTGDVGTLIRATPSGQCMRWALYSRKPLESWVRGRVCLLGDAAHPMTPFYGMGAAMAIEDAMVLARCFEKADGWESALQRYQSARLDRGNEMQKISLVRADAYMNPNPEKRALSPSDGLGKFMHYDPITAEI